METFEVEREKIEKFVSKMISMNSRLELNRHYYFRSSK